MVEKKEVFKQAVKQKGLFPYDELYKFCFNWLKDENYKVAEDSYSEKVSSFGKEIEIKWTAKKKVSDYFRNKIVVKWHTLGMTETEVEVSGKKEKTNKGEIKITVTAELERDYEERWEDKPFWKFMRGFYDKYIARTTMEEYEEDLSNKANTYTEDIKAFLRLEGKK